MISAAARAADRSRLPPWRGAEAVARLLREVAQSDELGALPAFASECLATTARFFIDIVVLPLVLRALYGEKLGAHDIAPHVAGGVAFFLAGCRQGGVS